MIKIFLFIFALCSAAAAEQPKKAPAKAAPSKKPAAAAKPKPAPEPLRIPAGATQVQPGTWAGDVVHFTRPGPFGTYKWTKKKSELNDREQAAWKRERERSGRTEERKPE
jgi:hypothetical protein